MATIIGHAAFASSIAKIFQDKFTDNQRAPMLRLACWISILPDADVIAFALGIPYEDQFGHRGFSHSIVFALLISFISFLICKYWYKRKSLVVSNWLFLILFLAALSHPLIDMLTDGGLGCALYWPLDLLRYFFPITPIPVSPIGLTAALINVLKWELVLIFPFTIMSFLYKSNLSSNLKYFGIFLSFIICTFSYYLRVQHMF